MDVESFPVKLQICRRTDNQEDFKSSNIRRYKNLANQLIQSPIPIERENQAQWEQAVWYMSNPHFCYSQQNPLETIPGAEQLRGLKGWKECICIWNRWIILNFILIFKNGGGGDKLGPAVLLILYKRWSENQLLTDYCPNPGSPTAETNVQP